MLARAVRLVSAADYRNTVRRGRRASNALMTVYAVRSSDGSDTTRDWRFGFIVSKAVGNAVVRNRVRRRLKACCHGILPDVTGLPSTYDVVVRAHPDSPAAPFSTLESDLRRLMSRAIGENIPELRPRVQEVSSS